MKTAGSGTASGRPGILTGPRRNNISVSYLLKLFTARSSLS